jgi:hypothetical protein
LGLILSLSKDEAQNPRLSHAAALLPPRSRARLRASMPDKPARPALSKPGQEARDARLRRQAEALRANLARRKRRERALGGAVDKPGTAGEALDSKGPAKKPGGA